MTTTQIIENFLNRKRLAIISRIPQASGRTANRLYVVADSTGGSLIGPDYIGALEDGRGPTKTSTPSNPTLAEAIEEWMAYVGFNLKRGQNRRSVAKAIARSIHENGTKLYQRGGKSGVLSESINEKAFDSLLSELSEAQLISISTEVVNKFKLELKRT